jgi:hypothetical protein
LKWQELLGERQVGVSAKGGGEAAIHLTRQVWERHVAEEDYVIFKVDMRNAYNRVFRRIFLERVRLDLPGMYRYAFLLYGEVSNMTFGQWLISSEEGAQQGCSLAALLFSLCLMPLVEEMQLEFPELDLNLWYIDDGTLAGKVGVVAEAFEWLLRKFPENGLDPRPDKCQLVWPSGSRVGDDLFPENVVRYEDQNMDLLGSAIGVPEHVTAYSRGKIERWLELAEEVGNMEDVHIALTLLRFCCGFGKVVHLIRTVPSTVSGEVVKEYDKGMMDVVGKVLGAKLDEEACIRANLAVRAGGLGLRHGAEHAGAAFLASYTLSSRLLADLEEDCEHKQDARDHAAQRLGDMAKEEVETLLDGELVSQSEVSAEIDAVAAQKLWQNYGP